MEHVGNHYPGNRFTDEHLETLLTMACQGADPQEIADHLGRSVAAVTVKTRKLGYAIGWLQQHGTKELVDEIMARKNVFRT